MNFTLEKLQFVTVKIKYLKALYDVDSEVFYSPTSNYEEKPHVGILVNNDGYDYIIPLTSAKPKHKKWDDVTAVNHLVYEIVLRSICDNNDVLKVIEGNSDKVKRIMSVIEIRKMIPVKKGVYEYLNFSMFDLSIKEERQRYNLLQKEYDFCNNIIDQLAKKATKIYSKQIKQNKILPFHCNYKKLEEVCNTYKVEKKGFMARMSPFFMPAIHSE